MRSSLCGSSDDDLPSSSCDRQRKHGGQHATQTQHRSTRDANTAAVNTRRKHSGGQHATQTQQRSTHDANTAAVNPRRKYGGQHTTQTQRSTPGVGSLRRVVPGITVMPLGFTVGRPSSLFPSRIVRFSSFFHFARPLNSVNYLQYVGGRRRAKN